MKFLKICGVILGVLIIGDGLYCMLNPGITYLGIGYAIGIGMILDAAGQIYAWFQYKKQGEADGWMLAGGILSALFGVLLIGNAAAQLYVDVFVAFMAATWILVHAVITVVRAFRARKLHKKFETRIVGKHWWVSLIIGILMCVFAVLSFINPSVIMASIGMFIGLGIIVVGVRMILLAGTPSVQGDK